MGNDPCEAVESGAMAKPSVGDIYQGRYKILSELGAGGMGVVFRALQLDADREVALKLLQGDKIQDEDAKARFYREFKLLSILSHPNILTTYGMALDNDSMPYAICEFIDGKSLRGDLQNGALEWRRALKICIQICNAMQYAHDQGVFHRDLKPENVMLTTIPEPDFVKLVDFGLSRLLVQNEAVQKLTMTGNLIGTAQYMSPELISGRPDSRTDIYALGCILFELLSGNYLFEADTAIGVLYMHSNSDPSVRLKFLSKCPPALLKVLAKMLQKNPEQRYQLMSEVAKDLEEILEDPTKETSQTATKKLSKGVLAVCAIGMVLFASTVFLVIAKRSDQSETLVAKSPHLLGKGVSVYSMVHDGEAFYNAKKYKESLALLQKAVAKYNPKQNSEIDLAGLHYNLAKDYRNLGDKVSEEKELRLALAAELNPSQRLLYVDRLAILFANQKRMDEADRLYRRYLTEYEQNYPDSSSLPYFCSEYSRLLLRLHKKEEAFKIAKRGLDLCDALPSGRLHKGSVELSFECYDHYVEAGKMSEGLAQIHKTRDCLTEFTGPDYFTSNVVFRNAVDALEDWGIEARERGLLSEAKETLQHVFTSSVHCSNPESAKHVRTIATEHLKLIEEAMALSKKSS